MVKLVHICLIPEPALLTTRPKRTLSPIVIISWFFHLKLWQILWFKSIGTEEERNESREPGRKHFKRQHTVYNEEQMKDPHQQPRLGTSSSKRKLICHSRKNTADITSDGTSSRWDKKYTAAEKGCLQTGNWERPDHQRG